MLTFDACQGSEADVVILSMVRTAGVTDFLEDRRRMCVALSRAKRECVIVGNAANFVRYGSSMWRTIVAHFQQGGAAARRRNGGSASTAELASGLGCTRL